MIQLILILLFNFYSYGIIPLPAETWQLQQLINNSEKQIEALNKLLKNEKINIDSLSKSSEALQQLSEGINQSVKQYQGTQVYEEALIQLQKMNDFEKTYIDSKKVRSYLPKNYIQSKNNQKQFNDLMVFQKNSVKANQSDLKYQKKLMHSLKSAKPGFISKIQAQAQLGQWQANTRLSAQLTELLSQISAMREELRLLRLDESKADPIRSLINGVKLQTQKASRNK